MCDMTRVDLDAHNRPPELKGIEAREQTPMIGQPPASCDVTRSPGFFRHTDLGTLWGRFQPSLLIGLDEFVDENYQMIPKNKCGQYEQKCESDQKGPLRD